MVEMRMARQQFVTLKQAIDALVGAGTPGLGEADAALCRQLAFLPLAAWPPASFHSAWMLVCAATPLAQPRYRCWIAL